MSVADLAVDIGGVFPLADVGQLVSRRVAMSRFVVLGPTAWDDPVLVGVDEGVPEEVEDARRRMRDGVRRGVGRIAKGLRHHTPPALIAVLCAGAFAPIVAVVAGSGVAVAAGLGVLGGMGGNVLADVLVDAVRRLRRHEDSGAVAEEAAETQLAALVTEVLDRGDQRAAELRGEIIAVLTETGAATAAIEAAVHSGDAELLAAIVAGFQDMAGQFQEVHADHRRHESVLRQILKRSQRQGVEFRILAKRLAALTSDMTGERGQTSPAWSEAPPFLGLAPFRQHDAAVFFGREHLTAQLVEFVAGRLADGGITVVTGSSGAGKSSLLRAGLMSAIADDGLGVPGSVDWPRVVMNPGRSPLSELSAHVAALGGGDPVEIRRSLLAEPEQARTYVRRALLARSGDSTCLVLVVDQFEELFTLVGDIERRAFVTALDAIARAGGMVVLGLRGDFVDRCAAHAPLVPVLQEGTFIVGPMTTEELRQAITGPAWVAGLTLDDGLADDVLADLVQSATEAEPSPAVLPLLSQSMFLTWQNRQGDRLTRRAYLATGGISRAVAEGAEHVYRALSPAQRQTAERLFRYLTVLTVDGRLTRRTVGHDDLAAAVPDADEVLEVFTAQRLVVRAETTAEIAHDTLLRQWPRLHGWMSADRTLLILQAQVDADARVWDVAGRDDSYLYQGHQLATATEARQAWASNRFPVLETTAEEFLDEGQRVAGRRRRRRRLARSGVAALTAVALTAAGLTVIARNDAYRAEAAQLSRDLAAGSAVLRGEDGELAGLLSAAAWRVSETDDAFAAMTMAANDPSVGLLTDERFTAVDGVAFRRDGSMLLTKADNGVVTLWRTDTWQPANMADTAPGGGFSAVAFSPDGASFAANSQDGVKIWRTDRERVDRVLNQVTDSADLAFSPDGSKLVTAEFQQARVWDIATGRQLAAIADPASHVAFTADATVLTGGEDGAVRRWSSAGEPLSSTTFTGKIDYLWSSPDTDRTVVCTGIECYIGVLGSDRMVRLPAAGRVAVNANADLIAARDYGGFVNVWDTTTTEQVGRFSAPAQASFLAFHGSTLAAGTGRGVQLWNIDQAKLPVFRRIPTGDSTKAVAFTLDGSGLISTGANGTVEWRLTGTTAEKVREYPDHPGRTIALSPDGTMVATTGEASKLSEIDLWDRASGRLLYTLTGHTAVVGSLAFSPDSRTLVSGAGQVLSNKLGPDSTAILWDTKTGEPRRKLTGHTKSVWQVAFSPDGTTIATADDAGTVYLWDPITGNKKNTLHGSRGIPTSLVFTHDSTKLVASSRGLSIWDIRTGIHRLGATAGLSDNTQYDDVTLSPDDRFAVLRKDVFEVEVWDMTRDRVVTKVKFAGSVSDIKFAATTWTIATATAVGVSLTTATHLQTPLAAVCAQAGRSLTPEEWAKYLPSRPYNSFRIC